MRVAKRKNCLPNYFFWKKHCSRKAFLVVVVVEEVEVDVVVVVDHKPTFTVWSKLGQ